MMNIYLRCLGLLLVSLTLAGATGCGGDDGPDRYRVYGTVTYNGQPVPYGTIQFEPDAGQGNSGPPGVAIIQDGAYDTSDSGGKGTVGGPQVVKINGYQRDPEGLSDADLIGLVLFENYDTTVDLPQSKQEANFAVPAEVSD